MVGGSEYVDVRQVVGHRERTDQLGGVDEDDRPDGTGDPADRHDVGAMAGRALHAAERDHPGGLVDETGDVVGLETPVAEGHLAHVVPLVDELAPGEVVGAVLPLADDDVLARRGRTELRADETRHRRERGDERDVRRLGPDQPGDGGPRRVGGPFALGEVEALRRSSGRSCGGRSRRAGCWPGPPTRCSGTPGRWSPGRAGGPRGGPESGLPRSWWPSVHRSDGRRNSVRRRGSSGLVDPRPRIWTTCPFWVVHSPPFRPRTGQVAVKRCRLPDSARCTWGGSAGCPRRGFFVMPARGWRR